MNKLFLIILANNTISTEFSQKIATLGNYYKLYENQHLLYAPFADAKTLYDTLIDENHNDTYIVIFELTVSDTYYYWGYTDKSLWAWLKSLSEQAAQTETEEHNEQ